MFARTNLQRVARAGHGRGMRSSLTDEDRARRPLEPSLSDFNTLLSGPNEPLLDEDGYLILWSE